MDEDTCDYLSELERRIELHLERLNEAVEQRDGLVLRELWGCVQLATGAAVAYVDDRAVRALGVKGFWGGVLFWIILCAAWPILSRVFSRLQAKDERELRRLPKWQVDAPRIRKRAADSPL